MRSFLLCSISRARRDAAQLSAAPTEAEFAPYLAALLFKDSEWVAATLHPHSRPERRQAERQQRPLPEVYALTLRRTETGSAAGGHSLGEAPDWSCSWIRAPHWRRQWCPGKATWEPRYIVETCARGNPDKPLRQPQGTVSVVRR